MQVTAHPVKQRRRFGLYFTDRKTKAQRQKCLPKATQPEIGQAHLHSRSLSFGTVSPALLGIENGKESEQGTEDACEEFSVWWVWTWQHPTPDFHQHSLATLCMLDLGLG